MTKKVFVLAGEASGDLLGAEAMQAIKHQTNGDVQFRGVGGKQMQAEGLESLYPMTDLSVMGLFEVLRRLPTLIKRMLQTEKAIRSWQPDLILTIDAPDFSFRLAKRVRDTGIKHVHYVAPTVWAWRPGRAKKIAKLIDHLLAVLPFEPPYFEKEGLPCTYVGHPVSRLGIDTIDRQQFRIQHNIAAETKLLCMLPGSREGEVTRLLPVFQETVKRLRQDDPDLKVVVPLADTVADKVKSLINMDVIYTNGEQEKYAAMRASDAALAASGTVSLQLAMAEIPFVIGYKMNPITAWLAKKVVKVPSMTLVNLLLDKPVVPEFFQNDCTSVRLCQALQDCFSPSKRTAFLKDLKEVKQKIESSNNFLYLS
ncbi:MAG: lipid-A-disaccharide synthase [Alphaproteobacteria bacterium]